MHADHDHHLAIMAALDIELARLRHELRNADKIRKAYEERRRARLKLAGHLAFLLVTLLITHDLLTMAGSLVIEGFDFVNRIA